MKKTTPNRLAEIRKKRKLTQDQLAEMLEVHPITISKVERGVMQMTIAWAERLAEVLNVEVTDFFAKTSYSIEAEQLGFILPDGEIVYGLDDDGNVDGRIEIPIEPRLDISTTWLQATRNVYWPQIHEQDMLQFVAVSLKDADLFTGRICIVEYEEDRQIVGVLQQGAGELFDVTPPNAPPMRNLKMLSLLVLYQVRAWMPWFDEEKESLAD